MNVTSCDMWHVTCDIPFLTNQIFKNQIVRRTLKSEWCQDKKTSIVVVIVVVVIAMTVFDLKVEHVTWRGQAPFNLFYQSF